MRLSVCLFIAHAMCTAAMPLRDTEPVNEVLGSAGTAIPQATPTHDSVNPPRKARAAPSAFYHPGIHMKNQDGDEIKRQQRRIPFAKESSADHAGFPLRRNIVMYEQGLGPADEHTSGHQQQRRIPFAKESTADHTGSPLRRDVEIDYQGLGPVEIPTTSTRHIEPTANEHSSGHQQQRRIPFSKKSSADQTVSPIRRDLEIDYQGLGPAEIPTTSTRHIEPTANEYESVHQQQRRSPFAEESSADHTDSPLRRGIEIGDQGLGPAEMPTSSTHLFEPTANEHESGHKQQRRIPFAKESSGDHTDSPLRRNTFGYDVPLQLPTK